MTETQQRQIFESWLSQHKGLLFKIVRAYAVTTMDREDLFQEIALQVWRSIPRFRNESAVTTWLYRIALNNAIRWVNKERKYSKTEIFDQTQPVLQDNNILADEQLAWLYREIYQLDEIDRSIFILLIDGLSYKEMAEILGITESNVGVKINRIKKQLIAKSKKTEPYGI